MSSLADALTGLAAGSDSRTVNAPESFRPHYDLDESRGGVIVSKPRTLADAPDIADVFGDWNLDSSQWRIVSVRRSQWQRYDGEYLTAARVTVVPLDSAAEVRSDAELPNILASLDKWKPTRAKVTTGELAYVVNVGDTQYGKDAGGGTEAAVERILSAYSESVARLHSLRRSGKSIGTVVLPQLGDCIEGTTSQAGKVRGQSDLSLTGQIRLGRRMLLALVKAYAPLADRVIVPVVPGNHDETYRDLLTKPIDSWQVEVVSQVQDICTESGKFDHVEWRYPDEDSAQLAVDVNGTMLAFAHGHQMPSRDVAKWWGGQATGRTPVGAADVLITGHFHHFRAEQIGPRLWIQVPSMDGGSPWFVNRTGLESPPGLVTLVVGAGYDPRTDLGIVGGVR